MKILFDSYDWKARVAPAFIISLPAITVLTTCFDWPGPVLSKILDGSIWVILIYALIIPVRKNGNIIEPGLWKQWDGPPSTVIMRWRDERMGKNLKRQYHQAVKDYLNLPMPTQEEEASDPQVSDAKITDAFRRVRGVLRDKDPNGLWATDNANYGFYRNLLGTRELWVTLSIAGILINGLFTIITKNKAVIGGLAGNVVFLLFALYIGWQPLPKGIRHIAFRYADNAWESFLNISSKGK